MERLKQDKKKLIVYASAVAILVLAALVLAIENNDVAAVFSNEPEERSYIKWVDFNPTAEILNRAIKYDTESYGSQVHLNFIELLSYTAAKCGGNFSGKGAAAEMDKLVERLNAGELMKDIADGLKYYDYYITAYGAVLNGFLGEYSIEVEDEASPSGKRWEDGYGLTVFSPIAKGYGFSHYKDFGNERTYGYKRKHQGNDLMGYVGMPIVAIESGYIEELGWNRFGGWRIGIRSFDNLRYYYYAHMQKDHPYVKTLKEGDVVMAGDVIGYMGLTGYSNTENVNQLKRPHLHLGLQLIFEEIQKEGSNQIWIDVYHLVEVLQKNKSEVVKDEETGDYKRKYGFRLRGDEVINSEGGN